MSPPETVDSLEFTVLVDNATDSLSSVPKFVETEFAGLARRRGGHWVLSGGSLCCAAHGLSILITVRKGKTARTLLFDAGPEDRTFEQNVSRLGVDLGTVEAIVLSHGHWDHGGGMLRALQMVRDRNGAREVPFYAHPDMFRTRAMSFDNDVLRLMEDVPGIQDLSAHGARAITTTGPQLALDGMAFVSGEIPRVTAFEHGLKGQRRRTLDGSGWEPDELVMDERFLAVNVAGKGVVVFTACSHAGVVNVLAHARETFRETPLYAVVGGLHLAGSNEAIIPQTIEGLRGLRLSVIAAGHCTGWRATSALSAAFGDGTLVPLAVGKRFTF
jgi:7,8-dihydropterin-6-yl-methyl-4-(beta-D-ribofuranosyl)aminobenzene 5'-phosphate synthase